jgi:hypothetical protein
MSGTLQVVLRVAYVLNVCQERFNLEQRRKRKKFNGLGSWKSMVPSPFKSDSMTNSRISSSVGFCPIDLVATLANFLASSTTKTSNKLERFTLAKLI